MFTLIFGLLSAYVSIAVMVEIVKGAIWLFRSFFSFGLALFIGLSIISVMVDSGSLFLAALLFLFIANIIRGSRKEPRVRREKTVRTEPRKKTEPVVRESIPVVKDAVKNPELAPAYRELSSILKMARSFRNESIRNSAIEMCRKSQMILDLLREEPDRIQETRQFWNYYLPSTANILRKYDRLDRSGVADWDTIQKVRQYLEDMNHALESIYSSLFDVDRKSLSIEMDALTLSMQREGLVSDDEVVASDGMIHLAI